MIRFSFLLLMCIALQVLHAQKKPLDHHVYDSWQSIGQKLISHDGKWVVYTVDPQEGDNELVIQTADGSRKKMIPRGYNATITEDNRYVIFRIRPLFNDTRQARIKKKKPDEMPKDSLGLLLLGTDSVWKKANVKGYQTPTKGAGWLAYLVDKLPAKKSEDSTGQKTIDSLQRLVDSLRTALSQTLRGKTRRADAGFDEPMLDESDGSFYTIRHDDADEGDTSAARKEAGAELRLRNLLSGEERSFNNVLDYLFSKNGLKLLLHQRQVTKDSPGKNLVLLFDLRKGFADTIARDGNEFKSFAFSDDGSQLAFLAERDAKPRDLQKFYKLWYYRDGMDSAMMLVAKTSVGMMIGMTVSEHFAPWFSKSGTRLFFGASPVQAPKDTTLIDMDLVKVDVWHYNDDYIQTVQLNRLQQELERSYLTVYDLLDSSIQQLGTRELPLVYATNEGDGEFFVGVSDLGRRIESQWTGTTKKDIYAVRVKDGSRMLVKKDLTGVIGNNYFSSTGKYILWYDSKARNYFVADGDTIRNITGKIKTSLYDEEYDSPADPPPYGVMGWHENDSLVYLYDRYDVWMVDPENKVEPRILNFGSQQYRNKSIVLRYLKTDPEEQYIANGSSLFFRLTDEKTKGSAIVRLNDLGLISTPDFVTEMGPFAYNSFQKAKDADAFVFTKENFQHSPDLYYTAVDSLHGIPGWHAGGYPVRQLSSINQQQKQFYWGTAELYSWKTFKGKSSQGILYKPENFDPSKQYPLILYFYERLSDGLNQYQPPAPTASRLNIPFFVSRGYLVFAPDIRYTIGHPAASAYDYIVSAAKDLAKHRWVDADHMGIQGQSWGGIQVAQLVTMTDLFKAAWAGAPVANMTSAYGGIRWETGLSRQFQYEKTQSRIGANLWEKPDLYIENSPLFQLPKVKTPLVIMANDADGAVPWYQGIELYNGLRRLGKKVWMLNYNGEGHNLVQRKNRKDLQIREQQYFDWLLKGEKPPKWIVDGVPATKKGKDWGLELVN